MDIVYSMERYFDASASARGEYPEKMAVILELEDHLADNEVLAFLLSLLFESAEYDLARVEILKILQKRQHHVQSEPWREQFSEAMAAILANRDDNYLVRQQAALSLNCALDADVVFDAAARVLSDPDDDSEVRLNALASIADVGASGRGI